MSYLVFLKKHLHENLVLAVFYSKWFKLSWNVAAALVAGDLFNFDGGTEDGDVSPMEKLSPGGARASVDSSAEKKPRKQRLRVGTGNGFEAVFLD